MFLLNLLWFCPLSPTPLSVCDLRLCWDDLQCSHQRLNGKMFNKIECLWCVPGILIYILPPLPVYIEEAELHSSAAQTLQGWVKRHSSRLKRAPHINQITCFSLCIFIYGGLVSVCRLCCDDGAWGRRWEKKKGTQRWGGKERKEENVPFPSTFTASGKALRRHPPSQSWGTFDIQSLEMGIKHYKRLGFAHWNELTPVCRDANAITRAGRRMQRLPVVMCEPMKVYPPSICRCWMWLYKMASNNKEVRSFLTILSPFPRRTLPRFTFIQRHVFARHIVGDKMSKHAR